MLAVDFRFPNPSLKREFKFNEFIRKLEFERRRKESELEGAKGAAVEGRRLKRAWARHVLQYWA